MAFSILVLICLITSILQSMGTGGLRKFPLNFQFGVSTSSYQIEGAWNASDKGENIWDRMTHTRSHMILNNSTGDITCDSYHQYKRDVEMLEELGVDFYRFSISWARLCPSGFCNKVSKDGLAYYNNLINELIAKNIKPVVTLYHWDLPQRLQDIGGWANPLLVDYFEDYAKVVYENFGDRIREWVTFNEPKEICLLGYGKTYKAPALNFEGIADYLCTGTLLKAHAKAYHLYNSRFKRKQKGRVGITISMIWFEPADNSTENIKAAKNLMDFENALYTHPIFSKEGDYPAYVKERVTHRSIEQKYAIPRLRSLLPSEVKLIRGSADFLGINHYTSKLSVMAPHNAVLEDPSFDDDHRANFYQDEKWQTPYEDRFKFVPWGFRKLLNWIKDEYHNPEVIIFENGFSDHGEMNDVVRVDYHRQYLNALVDALEDGCNITGYMIWTLMDNFEWRDGYTEHYGLYHVDFNDPKRTRTPKLSAKFYKDVIKNRAI